MTEEFTEKGKLVEYISSTLGVDPAKVEGALNRRYPHKPVQDGMHVSASIVSHPEEQIGLPCFLGKVIELDIAGKNPIQIGIRVRKKYDPESKQMVESKFVMTRIVDQSSRCPTRFVSNKLDRSIDELPPTLRSAQMDDILDLRTGANAMERIRKLTQGALPKGKTEPPKQKV